MSGLKEEMAHLELPLLIEYGVLPEEKDKALAVYEKYRYSPAAVSLLRCYYSDLPGSDDLQIDGHLFPGFRQSFNRSKYHFWFTSFDVYFSNSTVSGPTLRRQKPQVQ